MLALIRRIESNFSIDSVLFINKSNVYLFIMVILITALAFAIIYSIEKYNDILVMEVALH